MELRVIAYLILLAAVAATRFVELAISRRHQTKLRKSGVSKQPDPRYRWMVILHTAVLAGAALEVVFLRRPLIPILSSLSLLLFVLATALRWWVIRTLGAHWNVEVMASGDLGVITNGPFRWVRHPNYLGVFVELIALPLIHGAWITALVAAVGNAAVLHHRLRIEEPVLAQNPVYQREMLAKPRFVPGLF